MNFTYVYENDPANENLQGNLTWRIPNYDIPSHWIHTEDTCKFNEIKKTTNIIMLKLKNEMFEK